jgi:hypothetical protein
MEGYSGLIFVLIFIAFSILEGVGRKRKAQQKGEPGRAPALRPKETRLPGREGLGATTQLPTSPTAGGAGSDERKAGAEGLIPTDVWDEILGLARGTKPVPRQVERRPDLPVPSRREDETLEEIPPFEARSLEPLDVEDERPVSSRDRDPRSARAGPTEVASSRRPSAALQAAGSKAVAAAEGVTPLVDVWGQNRPRGGSLRESLFGRGTPQELRKAFILKEVLESPLALRE